MNANRFAHDVSASLRSATDTVTQGGVVQEDVLQAALGALTAGRASEREDYLRPQQFARYFRCVAKASANHGAQIADALLDCVGHGVPGAVSTLNECVTRGGDGSSLWQVPLPPAANPFVEPLTARAPRLRLTIEAGLAAQEDRELDVLVHILLVLPLSLEDRRANWRAYERFVTQRPKLTWPQGYAPAQDNDRDAIAPLASIACTTAKATPARDVASMNGSPNNLPGFEMCNKAMLELGRYREGFHPAILEAWSAQTWTDDAIYVLASSYLLNDTYRTGPAKPLVPRLLERLHQMPAGRTPGQAQLRKALVHVGAIDKSALPKSERASLPRTLPDTLKAAKTLASKLDLNGLFPAKGASASAIATAGMPGALAELYKLADGIDALRVRPLAQLGKLREEFAREISHHRTEAGDASAPLKIGDRLTLDPESCVPFATDESGNTFALARGLHSDKGEPVVIRFCHDECLNAELAAASVGEWLARKTLERWAAQQMLNDKVRALLRTPIHVAAP